MADLNKQSLEMWNAMKPMVDREIDQQTKGAVQRRKAKVTTAPSLVTKKIGVTEPFGDQYFIPYDAKVAGAKVGDVVWVEYMYGASNAFASMFAKAVEDPKSCSATLSSAGWFRVMNYTQSTAAYNQGATGAEIVFHITRRRTNAGEETHEVKMLCVYNDIRFVDEVSASLSGYQRIDKIRYTYDSNGGHVDIHVNNSAPAVCVDFEVYCEPDRQSMYTAASLESVADAPSGETVLSTYKLNANTEDVTDGWHYTLQGKYIRATKTITDTLTNYTTINGFYGYYIASITTPFTMANKRYYVGTTWSIGSGFSISAGILSQTTTKFNVYALATASGSQDVELTIVIEGEIA